MKNRIFESFKKEDKFNNIRYFIYMTNTFGRPIGEDLSLFCDEYIDIIANGNRIIDNVPSNKTRLEEHWKEVIKNCKSYKIKVTPIRNWGFYFYELLNKKASEMSSLLRDIKTREEKVEKLVEYISNLRLDMLELSERDEDILIDWSTSIAEMEKNIRVIGVPTGNPNEHMWCTYNEMTGEMKAIKGTEHHPALEGKTWDEYVDTQMKDIVTYLEQEAVDYYEIDNDIINEVEILTNYKLSHNEPVVVSVDGLAEAVKEIDINSKIAKREETGDKHIVKENTETKQDSGNDYVTNLLAGSASFMPEKPATDYQVIDRKNIFDFGNQPRLRVVKTFNGLTYNGILYKDGSIEVDYSKTKNKTIEKIGTKRYDSLVEATNAIEKSSLAGDTNIAELGWTDLKFKNIVIYLIDDEEKEMWCELYFDNTPDLIEYDMNGFKNIRCMIEYKGEIIKGRLYEDNSLMLDKGTKLWDICGSGVKMASLVKDRYMYAAHIDDDSRTKIDIKFNTCSVASSFVKGYNTNGWLTWKNIHGQFIDTYRERKEVADVTTSVNTPLTKNNEVTDKVEKKQPRSLPNTKVTFNNKFNLGLTPELIKHDYVGDYIEVKPDNYNDKNEFRIYENGNIMSIAGAKTYKIGSCQDTVVVRARAYRTSLKIPVSIEGITETDIISNSVYELTTLIYGEPLTKHLINEKGQPLAMYCDVASNDVLVGCKQFKLYNKQYLEVLIDEIEELDLFSEELGVKVKLNVHSGKVDVIEKGKYIHLADTYECMDHLVLYIYRYDDNLIALHCKSNLLSELKKYLRKFKYKNEFDEIDSVSTLYSKV